MSKGMLFLVVLLSIACNSSNKIAKGSTFKIVDLPAQDCFEDRKEVKTVTNIYGKIVVVVDRYMISAIDGSRYDICALPKAYQVDGKEINFSGKELEILPTERRAGTPFILTEIILDSKNITK